MEFYDIFLIALYVAAILSIAPFIMSIIVFTIAAVYVAIDSIVSAVISVFTWRPRS